MISFKYNKNNSYIPIFLFLLAGILWRTSLYIVSLYVAIPLLIVFCIIFYYKDFFNKKYSYLYLFVLFWMFLSSLVNPHDAALDEIIPIIASYLLSFSIWILLSTSSAVHFISNLAIPIAEKIIINQVILNIIANLIWMLHWSLLWSYTITKTIRRIVHHWKTSLCELPVSCTLQKMRTSCIVVFWITIPPFFVEIVEHVKWTERK